MAGDVGLLSVVIGHLIITVLQVGWGLGLGCSKAHGQERNRRTWPGEDLTFAALCAKLGTRDGVLKSLPLETVKTSEGTSRAEGEEEIGVGVGCR